MDYWNLIPWGISTILLIFTILTFARNGKKDYKAEMQQEDAKFDGIKESLVKVNVKLDTVCNTTNETRTDIKSMNKDMIGIDKRLTVLEENMKTVFSAIDELKGKAE